MQHFRVFYRSTTAYDVEAETPAEAEQKFREDLYNGSAVESELFQQPDNKDATCEVRAVDENGSIV